ncbi:MAG: hypothetical protein KF912_08900 [Phycisphaeraceae bacterium]|nr:hypothetical protein [Phycisphaeraceae bacterium]
MLREFKSGPRGTGMFDVDARIVGVHVDQPGRRGGQEFDRAGRQAWRARLRGDVLRFVSWHAARDAALAHTPLLTSRVCRARTWITGSRAARE